MPPDGIAAAFAPLIAAVPEPMVVLDSGGRVAAVNDLARALLTAPAGSAIDGRAIVDLIAFSADSIGALNALAQRPRAVELQGEIEARDGDAAGRAVSLTLGHVKEPPGYLGVLRDVT